MTGPTAHAILGASSMHRWGVCPGSVKASKGMPNVKSKYADEGTTAHDLAADLINLELRGNDGGDIADFQNKWKTIETEMAEAVGVYVQAFLSEIGPGDAAYVEKRFSLEKIYPGLFGTNDGMVHNSRTKTLQVWDLKYGAGLAVEVEENEQLMYYALGALLELGIKVDWIEMVICQPRCDHKDGPIRKWKIPAIELLDFAADLVEAAKRTEDPNAPFVSGEHCRFCPAVAKCPSLNEKALTSAKLEFSPLLPYDPKELAKTLAVLPSIEAWVKGVEEFAFSEATAGRIPPGFKLVQKQSRRKWIDEEIVESTLLLELGLDYTQVRETPSLKSPAQIEKLLSKDDKKVIERLTVKASSGVSLVSETDRRPSIAVDVKTEFSVITDETVTKE